MSRWFLHVELLSPAQEQATTDQKSFMKTINPAEVIEQVRRRTQLNYNFFFVPSFLLKLPRNRFWVFPYFSPTSRSDKIKKIIIISSLNDSIRLYLWNNNLSLERNVQWIRRNITEIFYWSFVPVRSPVGSPQSFPNETETERPGKRTNKIKLTAYCCPYLLPFRRIQ